MAFLIIVTCELIVLFRLGLPRILAFAERRYSDVYGDPLQNAFGDFPNTDCFNFHGPGDTQ